MLRSWGDRFGVVPAAFSFDTMTLIVRRRPQRPDEAHAAGVELKAFCSDLFTNYETQKDIEDYMAEARVWEFWWD